MLGTAAALLESAGPLVSSVGQYMSLLSGTSSTSPAPVRPVPAETSTALAPTQSSAIPAPVPAPAVTAGTATPSPTMQPASSGGAAGASPSTPSVAVPEPVPAPAPDLAAHPVTDDPGEARSVPTVTPGWACPADGAAPAAVPTAGAIRVDVTVHTGVPATADTTHALGPTVGPGEKRRSDG